MIDNVRSKTTNITTGLLQGSQLGPLLFIININVMTYKWNFIFADYCTLQISDLYPIRPVTL